MLRFIMRYVIILNREVYLTIYTEIMVCFHARMVIWIKSIYIIDMFVRENFNKELKI
jgi:hypothetical protein